MAAALPARLTRSRAPVDNVAGPAPGHPSVTRMPEIRVSAEDLSRLGESLAEVSAFLGALGHVGPVEPWALGPGSAAGALQAALGNWERRRIQLGRHLDELATAAQTVGGAYVQVESDVASRVGGSAR